jgi:8-oxo-dGTP pyrophosphatase MutT (NUDIX family)
LAGHLTASAWITNKAQTKAVLLHHKKLDIWVQPGGHVDDDDMSLSLASLREASEETGLTNLSFCQPGIFDLDVHSIPARKTEPKHHHLDVRFWLIADNERLSISDESNDLQWLSRVEIEAITNEESVLRMARKTLSL